MNRVLIYILGIQLLGLTGIAQAAILTINSSGQLTGATEVNVLGGLYDVELKPGSCNSLLENCTAFTFTTAEEATAASEAILDQVLIDDIAGQFDSDPTLTFGCGARPDFCAIATQYSVGLISGFPFVFGSLAQNFSDNTQDQEASPSIQNFDTLFSGDTSYAVWSQNASPVPVPATAWLLMSGLVGLVVRSRKSLQCQS